VFRGGFTIDAAQAVCAIEGDSILSGVTSLMNQSLVRRESVEDGKPRLGLLETIGDFGREQLVAAAEEPAVRLRHADYYRRLARIAEPKLAGSTQFRELARLESEVENIRAALDWGALEPSASDTALDLAASLLVFWWHRYIGEGSRRLQQLLDVPANKNSRHRARALAHASFLFSYDGNATACERLATESVELCRGFARPTGTLATGLGLIARMASSRGEHAVALASAAESVAVARALGGGFPLNIALGALGDVAFAINDQVLAEASWSECVEGFRRLDDRWLIAAPLALLGSLAVRRGDPERARRLFEESLGLWRAAGNGAGTPQAIASVGRLAMFEGDWTGAAATARESLLLAQQLGSRGEYCWGLAGIADASVSAGNYETACKLFAAADALGRDAGHSLQSFFEHDFAPSLAKLRNSIDATRYELLTVEGAALSSARAVALALGSVH
jgi:non-specific serine/threonine protein kinase